MADAWDPTQYARFARERAQPFHDLLALVRPIAGGRAIDLGCGPGDTTQKLHEAVGARETIGLDSSAAMLQKAAAFASAGLRFERGSIEDVRGGPFDLIFSNAALHWVQHHATLFLRLRDLLAPGGQLAVQMPANHEHSSHRAAAAVAGEPAFREALQGWERRVPLLKPDEYASLLYRLGFAEQRVELRVYGHELPARDDVIEWVKGTLLTDYKSRLGDALYAQFLARYRETLLPLLEDTKPYFYTYPRILLWARRPSSA